ncbi:MAG: DUF881 domain-containing protein [Fimbriimonadia bacterium]|nr:DUF881 domain-containing protein [Fimbriimonadia bacterium]
MSWLTNQFSRGNFWLAFFVMWLILGLLVGSALRAQHHIRTEELPSGRFPDLARAYVKEKKTVTDLETEIRQLRDNNTKLENALASGTQQAKVLNDGLQEAKMLAGLVEVEGPGLQLVLSDSTKKVGESATDAALAEIFIIHDYDLLRVVNELKQAGAEAIAVNGQRIVANTAIRCTGPIIYVNDIKLASPFTIEAIGDPNTLLGALKTPGGVLSDLENTDPKMVKLTTKEKILIPAFAGSTKYNWAKPTAPKASEKK